MKYLKTYRTFEEESQYTQSEGILFIESNEEMTDYDWNITFNVTSLWDKYLNKTLTLEQYNQKLSEFLKKQKDVIEEDCYTELTTILNELNITKEENNSEKLYNKIYDLFDKNNINLKIEEKDNGQEIQ